MKLLMKKMEVVVKGRVSMLEMRYLTKKGAYFMSYFVQSLSGGEGFMMDEAGLQHHIQKGRKGPLDHLVICLMGMFKGETGRRQHLQAVANESASKLKVRWWLERLNDELNRQGHRNGPA